MGKIIASVTTTFDGILSGPQGDEDNMISWAMSGVQDTMMDNLGLFQKSGKRYLDEIESRHDLKVMYTKFYEKSGCMLFHYEVIR